MRYFVYLASYIGVYLALFALCVSTDTDFRSNRFIDATLDDIRYFRVQYETGDVSVLLLQPCLQRV